MNYPLAICISIVVAVIWEEYAGVRQFYLRRKAAARKRRFIEFCNKNGEDGEAVSAAIDEAVQELMKKKMEEYVQQGYTEQEAGQLIYDRARKGIYN